MLGLKLIHFCKGGPRKLAMMKLFHIKYIEVSPTSLQITWSEASSYNVNTIRINQLDLVYHVFFSCDQAALWMVFFVRLVRLSHLFDYVSITVSSWHFQEISARTRVRSMQNVKVRDQRSKSQRSRPNFPDSNSSLNSHMMMKWCI